MEATNQTPPYWSHRLYEELGEALCRVMREAGSQGVKLNAVAYISITEFELIPGTPKGDAEFLKACGIEAEGVAG